MAGAVSVWLEGFDLEELSESKERVDEVRLEGFRVKMEWKTLREDCLIGGSGGGRGETKVGVRGGE